MRGCVKGSPLDRNGDSGCPILLQNSGWDPETAALRINANDESNGVGVRPFFPVTMEAVPSHQDLQPTHGEAFLRNDFTKYRSKFSDSMDEECVNDDADANSLAVNVHMRDRPFEPEMVLQLFGKIFRQWEVSAHQGGKRDFVVPLPDADVWPNVIHMYMGATWAREKQMPRDRLWIGSLKNLKHQRQLLLWKTLHKHTLSKAKNCGSINTFAYEWHVLRTMAGAARTIP